MNDAELRSSPLKGATFLILQKADNGVVMRGSSSMMTYPPDNSSVRVFTSFTDLCKEIAEVFEVPDSENIAKGG